MNQIIVNALLLACIPALPAPVAPAAPPMSDAAPPLAGVSFAKVSEYAMSVAERSNVRLGYEVTGFVLTQKTRGAKCIVDGKDAAWLPGDEAKKLLKWQAPKQSTPPEGYEPPPKDVTEGEAALGILAMRLGLGFNSSIPHNTGWFVPGIPDAFAGAGEAIEALFERIYTVPDATVYRPGKAGRATGETFAAPPAVANVITTAGLALAQTIMETAPPKKKAPPTMPEAHTAQESLF